MVGRSFADSEGWVGFGRRVGGWAAFGRGAQPVLNEKTLRVTPDPHTALSILYSVYTYIHEYTKVCQIYERLTNILYICGIHTNVSTYKYILVSSLILGLSCMIALYDLYTSI